MAWLPPRGYDAPMALLFLLGLGLVGGAVIVAAAEAVARVRPEAPPPGLFMSAADLWSLYFPTAFVDFQVMVAAVHPLLLDPVMTTVLAVPAWAVLGVPGLVLIWHGRPRGSGDDDGAFDPDALFLYDELARRAHEEGYLDGDDMAPDQDERPHPEEDDLELAQMAMEGDDRAPNYEDRPNAFPR